MPLFDTMLLERLQTKDSQTIKIVSDHLAKIITQTSQNNPEALSHSLQSVIAPTISQEIANNKDAMVDSLYPIMGGMISKYVSQALKEMMESINEKIEDGLSIDKYKRKIKSKITGVSETELLLEESGDAHISSLFVIHKESGLLIAEGHVHDKEIGDPHMVASMASAIKDFINDWIQKNESNNEVQILSYANETLYIESAGSVYLIAFLDKEPDSDLRSKINQFFASLVSKYATFFQKFDGDDSLPEVQALSEKMMAYLQAQAGNKKESASNRDKKPLKYLFWFMALLLSGYVVYLLNQWYVVYEMEKEIKDKTGQNVHLKQTDNTMEIIGYVDSFAHSRQIEMIIAENSEKELINHMSIPIGAIDERMIEQEKKPFVKQNDHDAKIAELEKKIAWMESQYGESQKESFLKVQKMKTDIHALADVRDRIIQTLKKKMPSSVHMEEDGSIDFKNMSLFKAESITINPEVVKPIIEVIESYITVLLGDEKIQSSIEHIVISAYTDSSGDYEDNLDLSYKRAYATMQYLSALPFAKQYDLKSYLKAEGLGERDLVMVNGVEDKESSRRIKIKFELKNSQILKNIKSMLHD